MKIDTEEGLETPRLSKLRWCSIADNNFKRDGNTWNQESAMIGIEYPIIQEGWRRTKTETR